jgi:hypothetical protein
MNSLNLSVVFLFASFLISCSNAKINNVSIDSPPESVFKGSSVQLKAVVNREGKPDTTLNWVIVEPVAKGTTITKEGLLTVSNDETAQLITIKAVSVGDTSKAASLGIKIQTDPKSFYGSWGSIRDNEARNLDLSENSIVFKHLSRGSGYTLSDIKWVPAYNEDPATNKDFPNGFYVTGIVSKSYKNAAETGLVQKNTLFISGDGKKILRTVDDDVLQIIVWTKKQ